MTDAELINFIKAGGRPKFGINGHNGEIMDLMARLEKRGLIRTEDASLSQETRRRAVWIAQTKEPDEHDQLRNLRYENL